MGSEEALKFSGGQSMNFAKLNKNAALTEYSAACDCAPRFPGKARISARKMRRAAPTLVPSGPPRFRSFENCKRRFAAMFSAREPPGNARKYFARVVRGNDPRVVYELQVARNQKVLAD